MADTLNKTEVKFNQASYQQERINDLMRTINLCWVNPVQFNFEFSDYNYRVIFRVLTSYYSEIRVKLKEEREEIDELMKSLDTYIESNPIIIPNTRVSLYNDGSRGMKFKDKTWNIIKKCLFIYQNKILDAAESHGMGNPTIKDPSKAAIDM